MLAKHWPNAGRYEDVRTIGAKNLDPVDVICGGFPCQDLSVAGRRAGLAGERSGLWYEFRRVVAELKPGWVVIENVPGLLSSNGGRDFAVLLSGLAECGYLSAWRVLDAQYFGLAQRRRRVFVVASLGTGRGTQVLFEQDGGNWDTPPSREAGPGFAAAITERTRSAGRTLETQDDLAYALTNPGSGGRTHSRMIAFSESGPGWWKNGIGALRERDYKDAAGGLICATSSIDDRISHWVDEPDKIRAIQGDGHSSTAQEHVYFKPNAVVNSLEHARPHKVILNDTVLDDQGGPERVPVICNTFNGYTGGPDDNDAQGWHQVPALADKCLTPWDAESKRIHPANGTAPTLAGSDGQGGQRFPNFAVSTGVRRLTPVECERLQGFPDNWTAGQSDSTRYRQLGNAVAVPVAEWIGRRIAEVANRD